MTAFIAFSRIEHICYVGLESVLKSYLPGTKLTKKYGDKTTQPVKIKNISKVEKYWF